MPALRFADPRIQALLHVLLLFVLAQGTFAHKDMRLHLAPLLGHKLGQLTPGRVTYDLRRLRLQGLIARIPKTHRYRITDKGLRIPKSHMAKAIHTAQTAVDTWYLKHPIAA